MSTNNVARIAELPEENRRALRSAVRYARVAGLVFIGFTLALAAWVALSTVNGTQPDFQTILIIAGVTTLLYGLALAPVLDVTGDSKAFHYVLTLLFAAIGVGGLLIWICGSITVHRAHKILQQAEGQIGRESI